MPLLGSFWKKKTNVRTERFTQTNMAMPEAAHVDTGRVRRHRKDHTELCQNPEKPLRQASQSW